MSFKVFLAAIALMAGSGLASAQALNDPAKDGMRVLPRVEGCIAPGGLQAITSASDPGDAMFWCGTPPYCLTLAVGNVERCHIIPGSRNNGTSGVRNPQDLLCDVASVNPTGPTHTYPGRCPVVPTLGVTINGSSSATVTRGDAVTLRINTDGAAILSDPTSFTMSCTGPNRGLIPFNITNLMPYAGQDRTFSPTTTTSDGVTSCTVTAANDAGSVSSTVAFTVNAPTPPPTLSASFNPNSGFTGGTTIRMNITVSNASSMSYSCSGATGWSFSNRNLGASSRYTNEGTPSGANTVNCTFTAVGAGGTSSTTARWTSVATGGSTGGSTGGGGVATSNTCEARGYSGQGRNASHPSTVYTYRSGAYGTGWWYCERRDSGGGGGSGGNQMDPILRCNSTASTLSIAGVPCQRLN